MRVKISVTTEAGLVYAGEVELSATNSTGKPIKSHARRRSVERHRGELDFGLPVRPFIKRHGNGMSGPKRLTLLVARIAEGSVSAGVQRSQVRKLWNKMTSLMGGTFNSAYETRARDNGWIGSPSAGLYKLLPAWEEIFSA